MSTVSSSWRYNDLTFSCGRRANGDFSNLLWPLPRRPPAATACSKASPQPVAVHLDDADLRLTNLRSLQLGHGSLNGDAGTLVEIRHRNNPGLYSSSRPTSHLPLLRHYEE